MRALFRVLGAIGIADAVWMAVAPRRWSEFWQRFVRDVGRRPLGSRAMAATELGFSLAFLLAPRRASGERRAPGGLKASTPGQAQAPA